MNNKQSIINNQLSVVFFGTGKYVLPILKVLRENFEVSLVLTTEVLASKGQALQTLPIWQFCKENGIDVLSVQQFNNSTISAIKGAKAPLGVLAYFGLIIPQEVLNIFPKGIINIHPSLLPLYRGPTPGQTAILNGDTKTGVTIIKLDEQVDHGPILAQQEIEVLPNDTSETLYARLFKIGSQMLPQVINKYLAGELKAQEQDHKKATFTKRLTREDGFIDLSKLEIGNWKLEIARRIRAFFPWPGVWTKATINNKLSIIKFLPENKIQVEGKKPMSYKDFINGYPKLQQELVELLGKLQ